MSDITDDEEDKPDAQVDAEADAEAEAEARAAAEAIARDFERSPTGMNLDLDLDMEDPGSSGFSISMLPPCLQDGHDHDHDELFCNVNPELLPPPGPYIRHLNFTNFRTIGSRRTQDEAVRGRFVTAGRLEGVLKVNNRRNDSRFLC